MPVPSKDNMLAQQAAPTAARGGGKAAKGGMLLPCKRGIEGVLLLHQPFEATGVICLHGSDATIVRATIVRGSFPLQRRQPRLFAFVIVKPSEALRCGWASRLSARLCIAISKRRAFVK